MLLSLRRMNRIRSIESGHAVAEAGVILETLHNAAADSGQRFPLTLGAKGSATVGGLVSTNAGGTQVLRFGPMRSLVQGLEAVLPDGSIHHGLTGLRKDNRGPSIDQLLIGAEGTLGIVTAARLTLVPAIASRSVAWLGLVCYTLQIYFDFSGYSDMAIGLMRMFGFRILENFNYPYIARSIREFWRRWHISLSSWFRDYVFYPLEFAGRRSKLARLRLGGEVVHLTGLLVDGARDDGMTIRTSLLEARFILGDETPDARQIVLLRRVVGRVREHDVEELLSPGGERPNGARGVDLDPDLVECHRLRAEVLERRLNPGAVSSRIHARVEVRVECVLGALVPFDHVADPVLV
mgnify:CR=1 FL=1